MAGFGYSMGWLRFVLEVGHGFVFDVGDGKGKGRVAIWWRIRCDFVKLNLVIGWVNCRFHGRSLGLGEAHGLP
ncbi:hypothetical protein M0R45_000170 [Rubus argutus]|uniref:Uncharacterized protein n=1 Tax=Rubus argutus TaxID=59490 RepID=A0AAW1VQ22_RUBAR